MMGQCVICSGQIRTVRFLAVRCCQLAKVDVLAGGA